jgi:hypothetical protein
MCIRVLGFSPSDIRKTAGMGCGAHAMVLTAPRLWAEADHRDAESRADCSSASGRRSRSVTGIRSRPRARELSRARGKRAQIAQSETLFDSGLQTRVRDAVRNS